MNDTLMAASPPAPAAVPHHPRGTWFAPAHGAVIGPGEVLGMAERCDAVLLGETHDRAEIHRWQLQVATALHARGNRIAVGFEMFPRRLQPVLDRWVAGELDTERFLVESEWFDVWGFDPEIYLPLFHFCRQQRVRMLALNCYRALVTRVRKEGWAAIPEAERDGLTPPAPPLEAHRHYLFDLTRGGAMPGAGRQMDATFDGFVAAQQAWDRAFAQNIAKVLREPDPPIVIGIIGRGHLEYGYGTPHQLRDLGIDKICILLPSGPGDDPARALAPGIGDAVFKLDSPEPPAGRRIRLGFTAAAAAGELRVTAVEADGAAAATVRVGDRLVAVAGRPVRTAIDLAAIQRRLLPGLVLPLDLIRNGATVAAAITVPDFARM